MFRHVPLALSLASVAGCAPAEAGPIVTVSDSAGVPVHSLTELPHWDDQDSRWGLVLERSIPTVVETSGEDPLLYQPQAYARLSDGTIVVLDGGDLRLVVLHPERAEVVHRFAPSGQGPGEIFSPNSVMWPAGPTSFWVLDQGNQRLSRFDTVGTLLEEHPVRFGDVGRLVVQDPVEHIPWSWSFFSRGDRDATTLVDSIGRLDLEIRALSFIAPMAPRVEEQQQVGPGTEIDLLAPIIWFAPLGPGGAVSGRSDSGRFRLYSMDGSLSRILDFPLERSSVTEGEKGRLLNDFNDRMGGRRAGLSPRYVGDHYSLFELMWGIDESHFALQQTDRSTPSGEPRIPEAQRVWRVFSTQGDYAGAVVFPAGVGHPVWIEDGRVIATHRDELGLITIHVYELVKPRLWRGFSGTRDRG